jgi:hypothetical protein
VLLKKCSRDYVGAGPYGIRRVGVPTPRNLSEFIIEVAVDLVWAVVVITRNCFRIGGDDQQQTSPTGLLRVNHRKRDRLGLPRCDDAVTVGLFNGDQQVLRGIRCSELAREAATPESRQRLLNMAREYLRAADLVRATDS